MTKRLLLMTLVATMMVGCGVFRKSERPQRPQKPQDLITILCVNDFAEMAQKQQVRIIDVRTRTEYRDGHIAGAENVDINQPDFLDRAKVKEGPVAVYCRRGNRSQKAAMMLAEQGFEVYDLGGGIEAWQQAGKPTVK